MGSKFKDQVIQYAKNVVSGKVKAGGNVRECKRFLDDLNRDDIELRTRDPDLVIMFTSKERRWKASRL